MKLNKAIVAGIATAALAIALSAGAVGYTFSNYLSVGSTGADVVALQSWLIANGFSIPAISSGAAAKGYFGSQTQSAVEAYQASVGIPNTGFVGPLTIASLNKGATATASTGTMAPACPTGFVCTPVMTTTTTTTGTTGTTVAAPTGITTPGVSGTLTIAQSGSVANGATFNTGQTVNIAGFKLQAGPSDMQVNTITADFNVRPWLFFSSFSLVNQTTGQVLIPSIPLSASTFTEITPSEDYRITVGGLNFVVPHAQTVNVVLQGQALSGISQSTGTYVNLIGASVRSIDGTGITDTETLTTLALPVTGTSVYGGVLYNGNQTANLVASIDPNSPLASVVQTQTGSVTSNVPIAIFDVQSQNNAATLQGLTVSLTLGSTTGSYMPSPATLANVINTVQLQAGGNTYYGNLVSNGNTGTVTFNSNVSVPLPLGTTVPLRIVANINQGVTGITLSASLVTPGSQSTSANFVGVDANYNTPTVAPGGTITSAATTFSTTAAVSVAPGTVGSPTYTNTTQSNVQGYTAATYPFTFTVSAGTSPIYVAANPTYAVTLNSSLAGTPGYAGAASTTIPTSISAASTISGDTNSGLGTNATGSYLVPANSSRTFTVNAIINNKGNASTASNAIVQIAGVYYSTSSTISGTTTEALYTSNLNSLQSPGVSLLTQ